MHQLAINQSEVTNTTAWLCFFEGLTSPGLLQLVFYRFRNESFEFFNHFGKARVDPRTFQVGSV